MKTYYTFECEELLQALNKLSKFQFKKVATKNLTQMRNRAVSSSSPSAGGTPVSTKLTRPQGGHGELRQSAYVDAGAHEMGYLKDYAPHVEYGHRLVNGGYVTGQRFLRRNLELQTPILENDTMNEIRSLI